MNAAAGPVRHDGHRPPQRVAVVGAGMVGLSAAWHLQAGGAEVTVLDRAGVAAGASWGNAGWLTPAKTTPLPEPAVLRYGLRTVLQPSSPVYVPVRADLHLARFLAGFARHCTRRSWNRAMTAYAAVNAAALDAFDELSAADAALETRTASPFLMCFATTAERDAALAELARVAAVQPVDAEPLSGDRARELEPALSGAVAAAVGVHGQRFIDPPAFMAALAADLRRRGVTIEEGRGVASVRDDGRHVTVVEDGARSGSGSGAASERRFDAVVLATGADLNRLGRPFGVRRLVQAGRGYSFDVGGERLPAGPVYLPTQRVACTPVRTDRGPRLRVAGMMEFRRPEEPLDRRRVHAIVEATRPYLDGVDLDHREDEWVGSRPCTTDGLPLVGRTRSERVFVAGGHGMWGIVLGPLTGRLLASQVLHGGTPAELRPFDPLR